MAERRLDSPPAASGGTRTRNLAPNQWSLGGMDSLASSPFLVICSRPACLGGRQLAGRVNHPCEGYYYEQVCFSEVQKVDSYNQTSWLLHAPSCVSG